MSEYSIPQNQAVELRYEAYLSQFRLTPLAQYPFHTNNLGSKFFSPQFHPVKSISGII